MKAFREITKRPRILFGSLIMLGLLVSAIFAPFIAPYNPSETNLLDRRKSPSLKHPFGTDNYGRDILSRIIFGSRISLQVGIISVSIGLFFGGLIGLFAGYIGGIFDNIVMRIMDILLAFPSLILAMVVIVALGRNIFNAMIAIGVWFAPNYARIGRSATISIKEEQFVEAARAIGSNDIRIILKHVLPNSLTSLIVYSTLNIGVAFLMEATLSFLGLGIQPPTPSWGAMINAGRSYLRIAPHIATIPGLAIMIAVLALNSIGEGLRDLLDPKTSVNRGA